MSMRLALFAGNVAAVAGFLAMALGIRPAAWLVVVGAVAAGAAVAWLVGGAAASYWREWRRRPTSTTST